MMIDISIDLEVGTLTNGHLDVHSVYTLESGESVNDILTPLLDDHFSDYAELKLIVQNNDNLIGSFKKIKLKSGRYRWILVD
jgi:hypothetical protein